MSNTIVRSALISGTRVDSGQQQALLDREKKKINDYNCSAELMVRAGDKIYNDFISRNYVTSAGGQFKPSTRNYVITKYSDEDRFIIETLLSKIPPSDLYDKEEASVVDFVKYLSNPGFIARRGDFYKLIKNFVQSYLSRTLGLVTTDPTAIDDVAAKYYNMLTGGNVSPIILQRLAFDPTASNVELTTAEKKRIIENYPYYTDGTEIDSFLQDILYHHNKMTDEYRPTLLGSKFVDHSSSMRVPLTPIVTGGIPPASSVIGPPVVVHSVPSVTIGPSSTDDDTGSTANSSIPTSPTVPSSSEAGPSTASKLAKIKAMLRSGRGDVPATELLAISKAIRLITDDMWENDQKLDTSDKGVSEAVGRIILALEDPYNYFYLDGDKIKSYNSTIINKLYNMFSIFERNGIKLKDGSEENFKLLLDEITGSGYLSRRRGRFKPTPRDEVKQLKAYFQAGGNSKSMIKKFNRLQQMNH